MPKKKKNKEQFVEDESDALEQSFQSMGEDFFDIITKAFENNLSINQGKVEASKENLQLLNNLDSYYDNVKKKWLPKFLQQVYTATQSITNYNIDYFGTFETEPSAFKKTATAVEQLINERLGIDADKKMVKLKPGGYMDSLLSDATIKNKVKELSYRGVTNAAGFNAFKTELKNYIVGNEEQLGGFKQFYRNYAYDMYAMVDRVEGEMFATEIGLKDFIYAGTVIDTTRHHCNECAGKVFSVEEAAKWKELIGKYKTVPGKREGTTKKVYIGPIVDNPATYNPIVQMGGYGCRHLPKWISKEVADKLRGKQKEKEKVDKKINTAVKNANNTATESKEKKLFVSITPIDNFLINYFNKQFSKAQIRKELLSIIQLKEFVKVKTPSTYKGNLYEIENRLRDSADDKNKQAAIPQLKNGFNVYMLPSSKKFGVKSADKIFEKNGKVYLVETKVITGVNKQSIIDRINEASEQSYAVMLNIVSNLSGIEVGKAAKMAITANKKVEHLFINIRGVGYYFDRQQAVGNKMLIELSKIK